MSHISNAIEKIGLIRLADQLGESYQTVQGWNKRGRIPAKHFAKFSSITGVSIHDLLAEYLASLDERREAA